MAVREYVGARYVPLFADPIEWNNTVAYEPLTIVLHEGNSYTSRQYVPIGIDIANTDYWALTGNYDAQVEMYRREVMKLGEQQVLYLKAYASVNDMKNDPKLQEGMIVRTESYSVQGYGGAEYIVSSAGQPNEMDIIALQNNLYANMVIGGTVDVAALGANPDGTSDSSQMIKRAFEIAVKNPIVVGGKDPIYKKSIDFPKGVYSVQTGDIISTLPFNTRIVVNGNGSVLNFNGFTGNAISINNNFQMSEWNNFTFHGNSDQMTLYYSTSTGHSQGNDFNNCSFTGTWKYCFNLVGSNNNSEYAYNSCRMSGEWDSFLYVGSTGTSDQFLNYWFTNCKYWSSSNMVTMYKGGHVSLVNCDFSDFHPSVETYLFNFLTTSHNYGTTTFNDFGSRYEIKTEFSRVMKCQWDNAQITFIGSDFSSQVPKANVDIAFTFEFNVPTSIVLFENCKLYGGIQHSTSVGGNVSTIRIKDSVLYYPRTIDSFFVKGSLANKLNIEVDNCYLYNKPLNGWVSKSGSARITDIYTYVNNNINSTSEFTIPTDNPTLVKATFSPLPQNNGNQRTVIVKSLIGTVDSVSGQVINIKKANRDILIPPNSTVMIGETAYPITAQDGSGYINVKITVSGAISAVAGDEVMIVLLNSTLTPNRAYALTKFEGPMILPNPITVSVTTDDADTSSFVKMELDYR